LVPDGDPPEAAEHVGRAERLVSEAYFCLALHAHLPYVRHPEHDVFFEESWLFEAVAETYAPIIWMLEDLAREGRRARLTMSLTPPLLHMLTDPLLVRRLKAYLDDRIGLAEKEISRARATDAERRLGEFYRDRFLRVRRTVFDEHGGRLPDAFASLRDRGLLEPITCAATHGFLPLLRSSSGAIRSQLREGVRTHERILGKRPRGIWLPECAYFKGLEGYLADEGIEFFFLETHGLVLADSYPVHDVYAPISLPNGVLAFARDPESSRQVWSAEEGYPGDFIYREFHRDIAWDREMDYIRGHILPDGTRVPTGLKYHRVTGRDVKLEHKDTYDPGQAREQARAHARHFVDARERQVARLVSRMGGRPPVITAPFDAELFGHWWFEGPDFLGEVFREIDRREPASGSERGGRVTLRAATAAEIVDRDDPMQVTVPSPSSWGDGGYYEVWLNGGNDYLYRHYEEMVKRLEELAPRASTLGPLERRALDQAGREALLAQASDWAFLMTVGTAKQFAQTQVRAHIRDFFRCESWARTGSVDRAGLEEIEARDPVFPGIDLSVYGSTS
jgi:1,4-alpha-glucan branching enzyme